MKRCTVLIVLLIVVVPLLLGLTIHPFNSARVAWDAPTHFEDGTPLPVNEAIRYEVGLVRPSDRENWLTLEDTALTEAVVTAPGEGDWVVALRAYRIGADQQYYSDTVYSDEVDGPFVLRFYRPPAAPAGLRLEGQ